ncbi:MAG: hypothetical protein IPM91_07390 [Bacteroidetes bacterium]|nr:hypothetical protein [Bacteroidota bacterium]
MFLHQISPTPEGLARGSFNCVGACNVGISNGILLTSGAVSNAIGPNNATGSGSAT